MNVVGFILLAIIFINVGIFFYTTGFFSHPGSFDLTPPIVSPPDYGGPSVPSGTTAVSGGKTGVSPVKVPAGFTRDQLSVYFGLVRFDRVEPGDNTGLEHIVLHASPKAGETINVTGWTLQANRAAQVIPQAISSLDLLHPTLEGDIRLSAGNILRIYSTRSAAGASFRLNRCTGYLQNHFSFVPSLPQECPAVNRSDIVTLTGSCQQYMLSLKTCQEPVIGRIPGGSDSLCSYYANTLNYLGCVDRYKSTPNFYSQEWRVWTGSPFLDDLHDRLLLLDRSGKLVDIYIY